MLHIERNSAALSIEKGKNIYAIPYDEAKARLLADGQILDLEKYQ